jgi:diaminohydroxyphosphoribosylaminopyrimidine deaminase/5-amino-6-(5-phosphoribosylamino)uracil reductase
MVGCVLTRDGEEIGVGWHREFGGAHAEVEALRAAGEHARGATAYVSLEPCNHTGKTPPCAAALLDAGVIRVVYAASDPGQTSGGGGDFLSRHGIQVVGPTHSPAQAFAENPGFFRRAAERPFVALKLAVSLDGKIASHSGETTRLTARSTDHWTHELRRGFDAILVGAGTARIDDPSLTVRLAEAPRVDPLRVVLDSRATLSPQALMLNDGGPSVLIVHAPSAPAGSVAGLSTQGARMLEVEGDKGGINLQAALVALGQEGLEHLLCEGGGILAAGLFEADLVDRLILLMSPQIIGEQGVPAFAGPAGSPKDHEWRRVPVESGPTEDGLCVLDRVRT